MNEEKKLANAQRAGCSFDLIAHFHGKAEITRGSRFSHPNFSFWSNVTLHGICHSKRFRIEFLCVCFFVYGVSFFRLPTHYILAIAISVSTSLTICNLTNVSEMFSK